jgi:hypothetical protein
MSSGKFISSAIRLSNQAQTQDLSESSTSSPRREALSVDRALTSDGHISVLRRPGMRFYSVPYACFARCFVHTDYAFPVFSSQFRRKTASTQAIETNHGKTQTKAKPNLVFITLH